MSDKLEGYRIPGHPDLAYVPDFITELEQDYLVQKIGETPLPKWKTVPTGRRLQYWGGILTKSNTLLPEPLPDWVALYPDLLTRLKDLSLYSTSKHGEPNQLLINEYLPGQGIDPHTDGPAYFPCTTTVSLLWPTLLLLHPPPPPPISSPHPIMTITVPDPLPIYILLEPRSLFVLEGDKYKDWKHEILHAFEDDFGAVECVNAGLLKGEKVKELVKEGGKKGVGRKVRREKRLSLTFREVEKVGRGLAGLMGGLMGTK